jgi:hypothetical protein
MQHTRVVSMLNSGSPHQRVFKRLGFAILAPEDGDAEVPGTLGPLFKSKKFCF